MRRILLAASCMAAILGGQAQAEHTGVEPRFDFSHGRMFVFGDSLSDTGNLLASIGAGGGPVYFDGRFSNGPVWHESFHGGLALSPLLGGVLGDPSNGINFAHGGARTSGFPIAPGGPILPGSVEQAQAFADLVSAGTIAAPGADDVFGVWIGGNNFLAGLGTGSLPDIALGVGEIQTTIQTLAGAGAENFLLFGLPLLGDTVDMPDAFRETVNLASRAFNAGIRDVDLAVSQAAGVDILYIDVAALFSDVFADPGLYGFTEVEIDCVSQGLLLGSCPDSWSDYDGIHPTRSAHAVIGRYVRANARGYDYAAEAIGNLTEMHYEVGRSIHGVARDSAREFSDHSSVYLLGRWFDGGVDSPEASGGVDFDGTLAGFGIGQRIHDSPYFVGGQFGWADASGTSETILASSAEMEQIFATLYGGYRGERYYVLLMGGQSGGDVETRRSTGFAERSEVYGTSDHRHKFFNAEGGMLFELGEIELAPFVQLTLAEYRQDGYREIGNLLAGQYEGEEFNSEIYGIGAFSKWEINHHWALSGTAKFVYEADAERDFEVVFNEVDVSEFELGPAVENWFELDGAIEARLTDHIHMNFTVGGVIADNVDETFGQLTIRWHR